MSACCHASIERKATPRFGAIRKIVAWVLPSVLLVLVPKCPVCLAAHVALWTGLGLSLSTATYLRWTILIVCCASLLVLIVSRLDRIAANFRRPKPETGSCPTK